MKTIADFRVSSAAPRGVTRPFILLGAFVVGSLVAPLTAQVTLSGTVATSAGGTLLNGDRPAFQEYFRQKKDGYGGLEDFTVTRATDDQLFRFEARVIPGNEEYRFAARWEKFDAYYIEANYLQFRTFYDGSGGLFRPRDLSFSYFDEALALDRSYLSFEIGTLVPGRPQWRLRYDRNTRNGTKNSVRWGDSNLAGQPFVPRAPVPSYLLVDEIRQIFSAEVAQQTDRANWKLAGRYERTELNNRHVARRRPMEPQDRYVTMYDGTKTDLFASHGFYERIVNEHLRVSAGGLITTVESALAGSRVYGDAPKAIYDAAFARRQAGDIGYYGLTGTTRLQQHLANLNVYYTPSEYWSFRPTVRYEHLRMKGVEDHTDTDFTGAALTPTIRPIEANNRNDWDEVIESLEVRYRRWSNLSLYVRAELNQGTGNLVEQSLLLTNQASVIDRDTDYTRYGQRYTASATWYARPGLTLAADYNYRLKLADYRNRRDSTANTNAATSRDRYPAYIVDSDIESRDASFRLSWRPRSSLSLVTRYAWQHALTTTTMDQLPEIMHGDLRRHIVTQSVTWNVTPRLYFATSVNLTYDQLTVPPHRLTMHSDNNYVSGALNAGYALGKITDLYLDVNHYRADNYIDNSAVTLPLNAGQKTQSAFLTWVRRQSPRLVYTARYGYAVNRDLAFVGLNDYKAHILYGKVQYKF
ncbi:MAG: hypothetical protein HZA31_13740 [Opitutae bacterium]|nr:hypothetical protein [Opitutae bacterium]